MNILLVRSLFFLIILLSLLCPFCSLYAQCTITPTCPSCPMGSGTFSGNGSVTVNNNNVANNLNQCSSANATIPNLNINNDLPGDVTLLFQHNTTITNLNWNNNNNNRTITLIVRNGATLTVNGMQNLPSNIRIINCENSTVNINTTMNINGTGFFLGNYGTSSFNVSGTLNITSSGATIENEGSIDTGQLTINTSGTAIRMGNNANWTTGVLNANNTNNPFCVPTNSCASFNITGAIENVNNPITASSDLLFCASNATSATYMNQNGRTGSATVGCPAQCFTPLSLTLLAFEGEREKDKVVLRWRVSSARLPASVKVESKRGTADFMAVGEGEKVGADELYTYYSFAETASPLPTYYRLQIQYSDRQFFYSPLLYFSPEPSALQAQVTIDFPYLRLDFHQLVSCLTLRIELSALDGRTHFSSQGTTCQKSFGIPIAGLASGIYIVKYVSEEANGMLKVFIP